MIATTRDPTFGCERAHGKRDRDGYVFHGRTRAHLAVWRERMGDIPNGMEIDHLCRRRDCVAIHHLELVTRMENERRKQWRYRLARTRCRRGHDLRTHRQITPEGGVVCRACRPT